MVKKKNSETYTPLEIIKNILYALLAVAIGIISVVIGLVVLLAAILIYAAPWIVCGVVILWAAVQMGVFGR